MDEKQLPEGTTYVEFTIPVGKLKSIIEMNGIDGMASFKLPIPDMPQKPNAAQYVPYQLCPKCNGQGIVSKPPYVAGDVNQWSATSSSFGCDVCGGAKIIPMHKIE